jgi:CBS domain-containing protein
MASEDLATVLPEGSIADAVRLMREKALRRIPVVEGARPIGVVSIGDLAVERDTDSALADISASEPNE